MKSISAFILLLICSLAASAQNASADRLAHAKSACIKQLKGSAADLAAANRELKSWGRFEVKDSCSASDVSIYMIARETREVGLCAAVVQIIGNPDNAVLWAGSRKCKGSATTPAITALMRQMKAEVGGGKTASAAPAKQSSSSKP